MNKVVYLYVVGLFCLPSNPTINAADMRDKVSAPIINDLVKPAYGPYKGPHFVTIDNHKDLMPKHLKEATTASCEKIRVRFWMGPTSPRLAYADFIYDLSKKKRVHTSSGGYSKQFEKEFEEIQDQEVQNGKTVMLRKDFGVSCIPENCMVAALTKNSYNHSAHLVVVTPKAENNEEFTINIHPATLSLGKAGTL